MATLQELREARKKMLELPLMYHGEITNCWVILDENKGKLKSPYNLNDAKIALIKEALIIYNGGIGNQANITNLYDNYTDPNGYIRECFANVAELKKTGILDE